MDWITVFLTEAEVQEALERMEAGMSKATMNEESYIDYNSHRNYLIELNSIINQLRSENEQLKADRSEFDMFIESQTRENKQLRELMQLAVEDIILCNSCKVCKFDNIQPDCTYRCEYCIIDCKCKFCIRGNFVWRHADKLGKLGVEV